MSNYVLYILTAILLAISLFKNKKKTKMALKKAWKAFENILPEFLGIIMLVGMLLAILNPELISKIIGKESGWVGVIIATLVGSVSMIPGFIAFPTAAMLLKSGAGYMQIAAFLSTLLMVSVVTIPLEIKYFGKKVTAGRNLLGLLFSFVVALIMGKVMGGF